MSDDARRREDAAIRMETEFRDFMMRYEHNEQLAQKYRDDHEIAHKLLLDSLNSRFEPLEDLYKTFNRPAKIIGAILLLMATPVLGAIGWGFFRWTVAHVQRAIDTSP